MKLTTLKPRLHATGQRLATLAPARPGTVERVRGWKGVNDRKRIRARDVGMCQECMRQGRMTLGGPVDHIKPLWDGGTDEDSNKELLCQDCHDVKSAREAAQRAGR